MTNNFNRGHSLEERFWSRIEKTDSCWNWKGHGEPCGYGFIRYKGHQWRVHQISWMLHRGLIPEGKQVLHKCDNPQCVNPDHLFLGSHADNMHDKAKKGRAGRALKPEQVARIRELGATTPLLQKEIAQQFNVDPSLISLILRRKI